jgi:alpha-tubulin suppressor-like RCC1 family protein
MILIANPLFASDPLLEEVRKEDNNNPLLQESGFFISPRPAISGGLLKEEKMITYSRKKETLFSGLLLILSLMGVTTETVFAFIILPIQYSSVQTNINLIKHISLPHIATGVISGTTLSDNVYLSDGSDFDFSYTRDFRWSGENGLKERFDFITEGGPIKYSYHIPYSITFDFPVEVYPGQRVYLNPNINWRSPSLQGSHDFNFRTEQYLWLNAPYDGLAPLEFFWSQYHDRLEFNGSFPLGPELGAVSMSFTLDSNSPWPLSDFGDGEASFKGVTQKLGGIGQLDTSGGITEVVGEDYIVVGTNPGVFRDAWYSSGDQISFCTSIPYVNIAAGILSGLGFTLNHYLDMYIWRQDKIKIELASLPFIDIPSNATPGTNFDLSNTPVQLEYKGIAVSEFQYPITTKMTFDGHFFDPKTLFEINLGSIPVGSAMSPIVDGNQYFTGQSIFNISGSVPVVSKCDGLVERLKLQGYFLTQDQYNALCLFPPQKVILLGNVDRIPSSPPASGSTPITPPETTTVIKKLNATVAAGASHSLAAKLNASIWSWGLNSHGQLGNEQQWNRNSPEQVGAGKDWESLAAGADYTAALRSDGTLWAWGGNIYGQLGDGKNADRYSPFQVGKDNDWVAVAAGDYHTLALKSDGTLWAWGRNDSGQLGDNTTAHKNAPQRVADLNDIVAMAGGAAHSVALKKDGTLWSWGLNDHGQLGDGTTTKRNSPGQVEKGCVSLATGAYYTAALKSDGTLWAWGGNMYGQLGDGTTAYKYTPVQVGTDNHWVSIAAGDYHTLALKSDGTLWAWGRNDSGQLGIGTTAQGNTPQKVGSLNDVVAMAGGGAHTVAQKIDGSVWAWGSNSSGQLGDCTFENRWLPVHVGVCEGQPPIAKAGLDQNVRLGSLVTLNGSQSYDPDSSSPKPLNFQWYQVGGPLTGLNGATTSLPTFVPTVAGKYEFIMTVDNGEFVDAWDSVFITVQGPIYLPLIRK